MAESTKFTINLLDCLCIIIFKLIPEQGGYSNFRKTKERSVLIALRKVAQSMTTLAEDFQGNQALVKKVIQLKSLRALAQAISRT